MMKNILTVFALVLVLAGCRREDFREMTVKIPSLSEANRDRVIEALAKYQGIDHNSYVWDFEAKTLHLKYDSMKIAQSNIRYAIDEKGIPVAFPVKTDRHAGY